MSANAYLYRRNGTYYFRWSIPLACRLRMAAGSPTELRISLRTTQPQAARRWAARCWLAALETAEGFLVSHRAIRYNDLISVIRERARMSDRSEADISALVRLDAIVGGVNLPKLQDALAHLDRLGAKFHVPIEHTSAALWTTRTLADGKLEHILVERVEDFADPAAMLTRSALVAALAAQENVLEVQTVHSHLPGMWEGNAAQKRFYEVRLDRPARVNLSAVLVDPALAQSVPAPAAPTSATIQSTSDATCDPMRLSDGQAMWLRTNTTWKKTTRDSYNSYVKQFIEIVGDKLTTELTANDFTNYDDLSRRLPSDWRTVHASTGMTLHKIADLPDSKLKKPKAKTLKEKGAGIRQFFDYLKNQGYWHGRYGQKLFQGLGADAENDYGRQSFTNVQLCDMFAGKGLERFKTAKYALFAWGPVLALYTGARRGEISQLTRDDIVLDGDGTWYLKITATKDDDGNGVLSPPAKSLKTKASRRSIPLHPAIIELGFLDFVNQFGGKEALFSEVRPQLRKTGEELSKWFKANILDSVGIAEPSYVFHCFRHTVIERFKHDSSLDYMACAYTGHGTKEDGLRANKVFSDVYGRSHSPVDLAKHLHPLLDYGIDWQPLKAILQSKQIEWNDTRKKILAQRAKEANSAPRSSSAASKRSR